LRPRPSCLSSTRGKFAPACVIPEAQKREMVIAYRKTIYTGLREVSDALVGYTGTREQRTQQRCWWARFRRARAVEPALQGGLDSYLQVLDSERNLFQGELVLAQLRLAEMQSFVQLYGH